MNVRRKWYTDATTEQIFDALAGSIAAGDVDAALDEHGHNGNASRDSGQLVVFAADGRQFRIVLDEVI